MALLRKKGLFDSGKVIFLPVETIAPNPEQPRRHFEPEKLEELACSIREMGLLQPLTVRRREGSWELVSGERRLRACKLAGLAQVPCLSIAVDDRSSSLLALVENLQRRDLDFWEEALALRRLVDDWGLSQEECARRIGKSQSAVANKLRILKHSPAVLEALRAGDLTERHARALLRLITEQEKLEVINMIIRLGMSVARTERYIDDLLTPKEPKQRKANVGVFLNNLTQSLSKIQQSGIPAISERRETDSQIVLTITIPK